MGIVLVLDVGIGRRRAVGTLNPRRCIVYIYIRFACVADSHLHVIRLTGYHRLVGCRYGTTIGHFLTVGHGQCGRCLRDTLQFTDKVADVWWLVIAAHLPYHGLAVLHVVPQRIVAPNGRRGGGINPDIVVGSTHDDFLAPVTEDVTLIAGRSLGVIIGHRPRQRSNQSLAILIDTACGILAIDVVERFLLQVTIPVDAHVLRHITLGQSGNVAIGDTRNSLVA